MKYQMTVILECETVEQANQQFAGMSRELRNAYDAAGQEIRFTPVTEYIEQG